DAQLVASAREAGGMFGKALAIALAGELRIDIKLSAAFDVVKQSRFLKWEVHFGRIEDAHDDDFVAARAQVTEFRLECLERREKIGKEDDEASLAGSFRDLLERRGKVGGGACRRVFQAHHQAMKVAGAKTGRQEVFDSGVEGDQANGVALQSKEVGDGGGR